MPLKEKKRVMTAGDMERALRRMSSEILERNRGCDNLIVIGTNDADMAAAANRVIAMGGGFVCAENGEIAAEVPLPIAGLMSHADAETVAQQNDVLNKAVHARGVPENVAPFMNMAFVSLTVIPHIKMTTHGLCDVATQTLLPLCTGE